LNNVDEDSSAKEKRPIFRPFLLSKQVFLERETFFLPPLEKEKKVQSFTQKRREKRGKKILLALISRKSKLHALLASIKKKGLKRSQLKDKREANSNIDSTLRGQ